MEYKVEEGKIIVRLDRGEEVVSSLLKIIKGYYSDYEGKLFIGNRSFLRFSNIVYISQKESLFTGTINYNLSLKDSNDLEIIKNFSAMKLTKLFFKILVFAINI